MRLLRYMALHCAHLLVAVIGTAMITTSFGKLFHPRSVAGVIAREWAMSIVCAAVIGLLMYRTWRWRPAIWVWIIGTIAGFRLFAGRNELGAKSEPVAADAARGHS